MKIQFHGSLLCILQPDLTYTPQSPSNRHQIEVVKAKVKITLSRMAGSA